MKPFVPIIRNLTDCLLAVWVWVCLSSVDVVNRVTEVWSRHVLVVSGVQCSCDVVCCS